MVNQKPILIAAPPRSGTTMIAGLLGKHGIWIGRGRTTNHPGTNPEFVSENQDIKQVLRAAAKKEGIGNWHVPVKQAKGSCLKKQAIEQFVPENCRWLIKTAWNLFFSSPLQVMYPNAYWILPYRHEDYIFDSMNRHPGMAKKSDKKKLQFIKGLQTIQSQVYRTAEVAAVIDVKKVSRKDTAEIKKLFGFVNIIPNWDVIDEWIQPDLMK